MNAAVLGTDQELIDEIMRRVTSGEKFWQLPLDKEYTKQIKSDIADNQEVGGRKAGTLPLPRSKGICRRTFLGTPGYRRNSVWDEAKRTVKGSDRIAVRTLLNLLIEPSHTLTVGGSVLKLNTHCLHVCIFWKRYTRFSRILTLTLVA